MLLKEVILNMRFCFVIALPLPGLCQQGLPHPQLVLVRLPSRRQPPERLCNISVGLLLGDPQRSLPSSQLNPRDSRLLLTHHLETDNVLLLSLFIIPALYKEESRLFFWCRVS